ncbi:LysR substrate-binding domain-containing protein [Micromonospora sp. M12]
MGQIRAGELGVLRAGVPPETPAVTLRALLDGLTTRAPGLDVELHELTTAEQVRMLPERTLDVGLVHHPVAADGLRFGTPVDVPWGAAAACLTAGPRPCGDPRVAGRPGSGGRAPATAPGWHDHLLTVCRQHGWHPPGCARPAIRSSSSGWCWPGRGGCGTGGGGPPGTRMAWRSIADVPLTKRTSAAWPDRSAHRRRRCSVSSPPRCWPTPTHRARAAPDVGTGGATLAGALRHDRVNRSDVALVTPRCAVIRRAARYG